jgi:glycosyltransferase involved in cell wall biosynthesis
MKIAFYAPMKAPDHPVPSGDRQMAKLLMAALAYAGHEVHLASRLRSYLKDASAASFGPALAQSCNEVARLEKQWSADGPADMWFSYHPYYKAPDLIGPTLAQRFGIPYVTCEASYSAKRDHNGWKDRQALVRNALNQSALNFYFTDRDRAGLLPIVAEATLAEIKPFTDMSDRLEADRRKQTAPGNLIAVAMMRPGDKFDSFRMLATSLAMVGDVPWHLTLVGDGPLAAQVKELFRKLPEDRLTWAGELSAAEISARLLESSIYVWPGCGEAYGMAYLEAQAAGLPVIAQNTAGVPAVVRHGETGILVGEGDSEAFASVIRGWIIDPAERLRFGDQASQFIRRERSIEQAATRIHLLLSEVFRQRTTVTE